MLKFISRDYPDFSDDYVMAMNIPSFSARRDAAYDRAIEILTGDVMGADRGKRASVYDSSLKLLMTALDNSNEISADLAHSPNTPNPYEQFLILLIDTVRASSSLLNHEIILYSEEKEMKSFIGKDFVPQARIAEAVFSQSEADIYRCIADLIKVAVPAIRTFRRSVYEKFKNEERERYDKAFKEYSYIYAAETQKDLNSQSGMKLSLSSESLIFSVLLLWILLVFQSGLPAEEIAEKILERARAGDISSQIELGDAYFHGVKGFLKNPDLAAFWFRKAAEKGSLPALFNLGICYESGTGVEKNEIQAYKCYNEAADGGIPEAKYNLAIILRKGIYDTKNETPDIPRNSQAAASILKELSDSGFVPAYAKLAEFYISGETLAKDLGQAHLLLQKSVDGGNPEGMLLLADCIYSGTGVSRDERKAFQLLEKASEKGNAEASAKLAYLYETGQGTEENSVKAFELLRKAAMKGLPMAQVKIGEHYLKGELTEENLSAARQWFSVAAENNSALAIFNLAVLAAEGIGEDKNDKKAASLFLKAAGLGEVHAEYNMASCYENGRGVPVDPEAAFYWFKRAAEQEDVKAQRSLAICYIKGKGTPENFQEGLKWLIKAAEKGDPEAREIVSDLNL